jgi:hypothetical protein
LKFNYNIEEDSYRITKAIGNYVNDDGVCIKELFRYRNVCLWEVFEPIVAIYLLPKILSNKKRRFNKWFYLFYNSFGIFSFFFKKNQKLSNIRDWYFVCFSDYIFNDTLKPLVDQCEENIDGFNYSIINNISRRKPSLSSIFYLITFLFRTRSEIQKLNIVNFEDKFYKNDFLYLTDYLFFNLIPKNFLVFETAIFLYKNNKPKVNLSIDVANPASRIFSVLAKNNNVLSLDIQFGHYESTDIEWRFSLSDKIFVWGKYYSDLFINSHGLNESKIEIAGSPKFDYLFDDPLFRNLFNLDSGRKILFASTYTISSYENIQKYEVINSFKLKLFLAVANRSNIQLFIKPHPLEDLNWLKKLEFPQNIFLLDKNASIKDQISLCDYYISFGSSSTFDALLQDKICFAVNFPGTKSNIDVFVKEDILNTIDSEADLDLILDNISNNSFVEPVRLELNRRRFLNDAINGSSMNFFSSSAIISNKILELLKLNYE